MFDDWSTSSLVFLGLLTIAVAWGLWYLQVLYDRQRSRSPNGPITVPFLGDIVPYLLAPDFYWNKLIPSYGDLTRLQFGKFPVVFVNSRVLVRRILSNPAFFDRPIFNTHHTPENPG